MTHWEPAVKFLLDPFLGDAAAVEVNIGFLVVSFALFRPMIDKLPIRLRQVFAKVPFLENRFVLAFAAHNMSCMTQRGFVRGNNLGLKLYCSSM